MVFIMNFLRDGGEGTGLRWIRLIHVSACRFSKSLNPHTYEVYDSRGALVNYVLGWGFSTA